ncbi:hypothetical protein ACFCYN_04605, partial [Gottfriedia sp. NPDC056225]|uniref:hypothetical protein n=1 Tax=Gottfriedia sp. NPDC056225 TaxID=3345751 RepID=UPI0035E2A7DF
MLNKQDIKYFFLLFPFCTTQFVNFEYRSLLNFLFEVFKVLAILYYLINFRRTKIEFNKIIWLLVAYEFCYLIPSVFNGSLTMRTFYLWIKEAYTIIFLGIIIAKLLKENYLRT